MNKTNLQQLAQFFRQFATLAIAGMPILTSIHLLKNSQYKKDFYILIQSIENDLLSGKSLSAIFSSHQAYFNEFICQLIRIGEYTGNLDGMLNNIADYLEKKLLLQNRIQQALFYPIIILITSLLLLIGMLIFVIPPFADLFQQTHITIPFVTVCLFYLSSHLIHFVCTIIFISIFIMLFLGCDLKKLLFTRLKKWFFCLPLISSCYQKIILVHFTKQLAISYTAGIPILEALRLTQHTSQPFSSIIQQVSQEVNSGISLHNAMEAHPIFPLLMVQMIKTGEESGMLGLMLEKITNYLESSLDIQLNKITQLVEPLIIIVLGVLIGVIVVAMYLPIFKLGSAL